jgi:uroporphyrinogen decarboxylase
MSDIPANLKDEMTSNERMLAFFTGQPLDRIPCAPLVGCHAARLIGCRVRDYNTSAKLMAEGQIAAYKLYRHDGIAVAVGQHLIAAAMGGEIFYPEENMPFMNRNPLSDESMLGQLPVPDPEKDGDLPVPLEAARIMKDRVGDEVGVNVIIGGPLTIASSIRGTQLLLRDLLRRKEFAHQLLELSLAAALATASAFARDGIPPVIVDPVATGSLISRQLAEEFAFPYTRRLIFELNKLCHGVILHICGDTSDRLDLMADSGAVAISLDNVVDLAFAKQQVGDRILISGNVSPVTTMLMGTPEDVMREARDNLRQAYDNPKGYILSTGCDLPIETPRENILALMNAARLYGKWPIDPERLM